METVAPLQFHDNGVKPVSGQMMFAPLAIQPYPTKRALYLDRANEIFNNPDASKEFAKYCKDNGFDEVHLYHYIDIVQSSRNFLALQNFMRLLYDNGVVKRFAVLGSSSTTSFNNFWNSTSDTTRKPNGINLELEFWNDVTSYPNWINTLTTLNNYCDSKNPDLYNTFYIGWFKNMGSLTDSTVARQMIQVSDNIDQHIYQNGKVSYTYGSSRYEAEAKGAKSLNKIVTINPIISTEEIAWGAPYDFQGYYLKALGYSGIEKNFIDDLNSKASSSVKSNVRIGKFKYFMKRYNYKAIPPKI